MGWIFLKHYVWHKQLWFFSFLLKFIFIFYDICFKIKVNISETIVIHMENSLESTYDYGHNSYISDNMINFKYIKIETIVIHLFDVITYESHLYQLIYLHLSDSHCILRHNLILYFLFIKQLDLYFFCLQKNYLHLLGCTLKNPYHF